MAVYEIPLIPGAQNLTTTLPGGVYGIRTQFDDVPMGGWQMDILDANNNPIICGIPLVTGVNLLGQYDYLGVGAGLYMSTDGDYLATPGYADLGVNSHLLFEA